MISNKRSSWWFYKFSFLEHTKCIENSMENMHNDVAVQRKLYRASD